MTLAQVKTPVEGFSGVVAGVSFVDGVGESDSPSALNYFRRHGYAIEGDPEPEPVSDEGEPEPAKPARRRRAPKAD